MEELPEMGGSFLMRLGLDLPFVWVYEADYQRKLASSIITRPKNHNIQNKFMESSTSYQKFGVAFGELPDVLYW